MKKYAKMCDLIECLGYVGAGIIGGVTITLAFVVLLVMPIIYATKIAESLFENTEAMLVVTFLLIFGYIGAIVGLGAFIGKKCEKEERKK